MQSLSPRVICSRLKRFLNHTNPKTTMLTKLIFTAIGFGLYAMIDAMLRAPVGYEDETGFHFGEEKE